jgi:hypothetical protein
MKKAKLEADRTGFLEKEFPNWKDDKINGLAKMTYADKTVYEGEFRENQKEGLGKIINVEHSVHLGRFVRGYAEGKGCFKWYHPNNKQQAQPNDQDLEDSHRELIVDEEAKPAKDISKSAPKSQSKCNQFT